MRIFEEQPLRNSFRFFFFPFSHNFNPAPLAGELGARDTSRDLPSQPRSVRAAAGGQGGAQGVLHAQVSLSAVFSVN